MSFVKISAGTAVRLLLASTKLHLLCAVTLRDASSEASGKTPRFNLVCLHSATSREICFYPPSCANKTVFISVIMQYTSSSGIAVLGGPQPLPKLPPAVIGFPVSEATQQNILWGGSSPTPNIHSEKQGFPFLSVSSSLTSLGWEVLRVVTPPPA